MFAASASVLASRLPSYSSRTGATGILAARRCFSSAPADEKSKPAPAEEKPKPVPPVAKVKPKKRRFRRLRYLLYGGVALGGYWKLHEHNKNVRRKAQLQDTNEHLHAPPRLDTLQNLKSQRPLDLLVIGGGATGCGVALDATTRGLHVGCIEQADFGSGASSKSTKLLWGGSRYLIRAGVDLLSSTKTLEDPVGAFTAFFHTFKMVLRCLGERNLLLEQQRHLTQWLPLGVPLDRWFIWPPPFDFPPAVIGPVSGMFVFFFKVYDFLGGFSSPMSYFLSTQSAKVAFPQLSGPNGSELKYVAVHSEAQHNDARTCLSLALTASNRGAHMANYVSATGFQFDPHGKAVAVNCVDEMTGEAFTVRANNIVLSTGAFSDEVRAMISTKNHKVEPLVNAVGGTHVVLPGSCCSKIMGLVNMQTSDKRILFYLPWLGHTLVGTTEYKDNSPNINKAPTEEDIQWVVNECNKYIHPDAKVKRSDVLSAWYGVRPLVLPGENQGHPSRDHYIEQDPVTKIWTIAGGKWTTFREMAEDTLDQVVHEIDGKLALAEPPVRKSDTKNILLVGEGPTQECPQGWHRNLGRVLSRDYDVPLDVAEHLSRTYGTRSFELLKEAGHKNWKRLHPDFPYIEAEVRYAIRKEFALTAMDILARRTRLAFLNVDACRASIPRVCDILGEELLWDERRVDREKDKARRLLSEEFIGSNTDEQLNLNAQPQAA